MTIPNFITGCGFIFVLFYLINIVAGGERWASFILIFFAGLSDALDGFLARHLKQESFMGAIMDPIKDRALLAAILLNLYILEPDSWKLIEVIILAEILIFTSWMFGTQKQQVKDKVWQYLHLAGKFRQASHLFFGSFAVLGILEIIPSLGAMMIASLLVLFIRLLIVIFAVIFAGGDIAQKN